MKKNEQNIEKISAYLDGELSHEENDEIKELLDSSLEIKRQHDEIAKLKKLTASSFKKLDEAPYFETRLMASLNEKSAFKNKLSRWYPAVGFSLLTILLMVVLKLNPNIIEDMFEKQKSNLAGFYTENLKPLLFAADLSNEDVFNFAFYSQLPLDRQQGEFIQFGYDDAGKEYFEINKSKLVVEGNLKKFKESLKLTAEQCADLDSIIEVYADGLQPLVLVNDKNTVAVNPGLWNYKKALTADLLAYAERSNRNEFRKVVPAGFSFASNNIENLVKTMKIQNSKSYIFLTADSIFSEEYSYDVNRHRQDVERLKRELRDLDSNLQKNITYRFKFDSTLLKFNNDDSWAKEFQVFIDSNNCRIHLSNIQIPNIVLPDFDSLNSYLENMTKNFQSFSFSLPVTPDIQSLEKFEFNFELPDSIEQFYDQWEQSDLDSILKQNQLHIDSLQSFNWKDFQFNSDSLSDYFEQHFKEWGNSWNREELKEQMQTFEEEMEKFREEMREFRKKFNESNPQNDSSAIEI